MGENGLICIVLSCRVKAICVSFPVNGQVDVLRSHLHQTVGLIHINLQTLFIL